MKNELEFYVEECLDNTPQWIISVLGADIDDPHNEIEIGTIDVNGNVTWKDDCEKYKDHPDLVKELKKFFSNYLFNTEDMINEIVNQLTYCREIFFDIIHKDGKCRYGVERVYAVETDFWAYGLVETESIVFIPYRQSMTEIKNMAIDIVNDLIEIVGSEDFCIVSD